MGASDLIGRLALAGIRLSLREPGQLAAEPREALTDELRALIRANKPALLAALYPLERGQEIRRQRALEKLAESPDRTRTAIFDIDADPSVVICTVAIRGVGTCELQIPRERYDPWAILDALRKADQ
jgi:hypothetical protein